MTKTIRVQSIKQRANPWSIVKPNVMLKMNACSYRLGQAMTVSVTVRDTVGRAAHSWAGDTLHTRSPFYRAPTARLYPSWEGARCAQMEDQVQAVRTVTMAPTFPAAGHARSTFGRKRLGQTNPTTPVATATTASVRTDSCGRSIRRDPMSVNPTPTSQTVDGVCQREWPGLESDERTRV